MLRLLRLMSSSGSMSSTCCSSSSVVCVHLSLSLRSIALWKMSSFVVVMFSEDCFRCGRSTDFVQLVWSAIIRSTIRCPSIVCVKNMCPQLVGLEPSGSRYVGSLISRRVYWLSSSSKCSIALPRVDLNWSPLCRVFLSGELTLNWRRGFSE